MASIPPIASSDFVKLLERIFLSARVSITVALVCGILLLAGNLIPSLAPIAQHYGLVVWLLFLVSSIYSLTFLAEWLWHSGAKKVAEWRGKRHLIERLHSLTLEEKHILQEHVEQENGVVSWSVNRQEISALVHSGLLGPIDQIGSIGTFKLPNGPRKYLLQHKQLIETPNNPRRTDRSSEWMI